MKTLRIVLPFALAALAAIPTLANAQENPGRQQRRERPAQTAPGAFRQGLPGLSPEERAKVEAAQKAVQDNPDVVKARKEADAAAAAVREANQKARAAAEKAQAALKAAAIKADPETEALYKKVEEARKQNETRFQQRGPQDRQGNDQRGQNPQRRGQGRGRGATPPPPPAPAPAE